jgi:TonB family protein
MFLRNQNKNRPNSFILFLIVSVLLHGLLFFLKLDIKTDREEDDNVSIFLYDTDRAENIKKEKTDIPETKKEEKLKGQVVDIAKPDVEKKPEKSKFLSEYNSSVKKETRADFDDNIKTRGKKLQKQLETEISGKNFESDDVYISGQKEKPLSDKLEKIKEGKLKGFDGIDGKYIKGEEQPESGVITGSEEKNQEGKEYVGGRAIPKRFLPYMNGRDSSLMSPSNDYLEDVDKADETALNTNKYLYASYFNKIKQAVSRHWTPAYVLMINDPKGHMYGSKDRYTKIIAMINPNGTLASIELETSSGMDFLDREAINAFKMAAPFQNPPEPLLNENNKMEIRFGFMVTME